MPYLTPADNKFLSMITGTFASRVNSNRRDMETGAVIAALRYYALEGLNASKTGAVKQILCKYVHEAKISDPKALTRYIIFPKTPEYMDRVSALPIVTALKAAYERTREYDGFGTWTSRKNELTFAELCGKSSGAVAVIERATYDELIASYTQQVLAADSAPLMIGTTLERKIGTKCFRCSSVKPRRVSCNVCGYIPSGGA